MNVARWLNGIGLGQYEKLFREHEVDADVLRDLTEADLENVRRQVRQSVMANPAPHTRFLTIPGSALKTAQGACLRTFR
jgi:hypothetical protein